MEHLKSKLALCYTCRQNERVLFHYTVKLQMQMQRSVADRVYKGPIDCARQIIQAKGVLGLWTGFTGSLACRSNFMWMFMGYEVITA